MIITLFTIIGAVLGAMVGMTFYPNDVHPWMAVFPSAGAAAGFIAAAIARN